jgi:Holliday junction resolvase RusA-like endonuclease
MKYVLYGNPIALARPRFGWKKIYDSQRQVKMEVALQLEQQHNERPFFEGPIEMDVTFYMPIVKSRGSLAKRSVLEGRYHLARPDLSNMIKFIEDVGNGIIYKDDSIVTKINAEKRYSLDPRTELTIRCL